MGIREITSLRELNLDYESKCENCGFKNKFFLRVFGEDVESYSAGLMSLIRDKGTRALSKANRRSLIDLLEKKQKIRDYHRCVRCGFYCKDALEKLRIKYPRYKRRSHINKWIKIILGILLCVFGGFGVVRNLLPDEQFSIVGLILSLI